MRGDIMCRIINVAEVCPSIGVSRIRLVQLGRAVAHSFQWIKYGWQHLVLDLDQAEGLFCDSGCLGCDEGDPITNVAHSTIKQIGVVRGWFWIGLTGGAMRYA